MRFQHLLFVLLLATGRCMAADPVDLVKKFYGEADALGVAGFSYQEDMERVRPHLTKDLNALFTEAQKAIAICLEKGQLEIAKLEAEGKQPIARKFTLGRMRVFTRSAEGVEYLGLGESSASGRRAYVQVKMKLPGEDLTWTDLLVLHLTDTGWKIDDIIFESNSKEWPVWSLRRELASSIEQAESMDE
jgi:hypothetical protein